MAVVERIAELSTALGQLRGEMDDVFEQDGFLLRL
jgi:hypothetical protein